VKKIIKFLFSDWLKSFKLEKRVFERKSIQVKVVFIICSRKFPEKSSNQQEAVANDISHRGMSLLVDHLRYDDLHIWKDDSFMDPNFLRVAFQLIGTDKVIETEAEVVNFSLASPRATKRYKLGIKFTEMSSESKISLGKFLSS